MINRLDHVNIIVRSIERTLAFYDGLGMACRPAPGQADMTRNAWIHSGDGRPVLHVGTGDIGLMPAQDRSRPGTGAIDHIALECSDYDGMRAGFERAGVAIVCNDVPAASLRQIFLSDPDGVTLELNFRDVPASG